MVRRAPSRPSGGNTITRPRSASGAGRFQSTGTSDGRGAGVYYWGGERADGYGNQALFDFEGSLKRSENRRRCGVLIRELRQFRDWSDIPSEYSRCD